MRIVLTRVPKTPLFSFIDRKKIQGKFYESLVTVFLCRDNYQGDFGEKLDSTGELPLVWLLFIDVNGGGSLRYLRVVGTVHRSTQVCVRVPRWTSLFI